MNVYDDHNDPLFNGPTPLAAIGVLLVIVVVFITVAIGLSYITGDDNEMTDSGFRVAVVAGCFEDEVAVAAPDSNPDHGLTWVCVPLDDFATDESIDNLDRLLNPEG